MKLYKFMQITKCYTIFVNKLQIFLKVDEHKFI